MSKLQTVLINLMLSFHLSRVTALFFKKQGTFLSDPKLLNGSEVRPEVRGVLLLQGAVPQDSDDQGSPLGEGSVHSVGSYHHGIPTGISVFSWQNPHIHKTLAKF